MLLYFNDAKYFTIDAISEMGGYDVLHNIHLTMPREDVTCCISYI